MRERNAAGVEKLEGYIMCEVRKTDERLCLMYYSYACDLGISLCSSAFSFHWLVWKDFDSSSGNELR